MKKNKFFLFAFVFLISLNSVCYEFGGFYKNFSQFLKSNNPNVENIYISSNKLRIKFSTNLSENLNFEIANEFTPTFHNSGFKKLFVKNSFSYRFDDFNNLAYPSTIEDANNLTIFNNLDRFVFVYHGETTDFYFGRQAIAFGSAMVINPTDIFSPFTFDSLDKEERVGVDAVRIRKSIGDFNELDLGFVAGNDLKEENNSYFLRGKLYISNTDLSFIYINYRENKLFGLNFEKSLFGAKVYFEGAYVSPKSKNYEVLQDNYTRVSLGFDFQLTSKTNIFSEFHYNGAGEKNSIYYNQLQFTNPYNEGAVYLMGESYLCFGSATTTSPLTSFSTLIMYNINDKSTYITNNLEYNVKEDIYITAGFNFGIGKKIEIEDNQLVYNSEFGSYPNLFYVSIRYYF